MPPKAAGTRKSVESLTHPEATRRNIPTAEYEPLLDDDTKSPIRV
jgi:adenine-specific DNA-methyltransferase